MSLIHLIHRPTYRFGIWHITENASILSSLSGCEPPEQLSHSGRKLEYLAVRALTKALGQVPDRIAYQASGKPYLTDSDETISISHTKHYAAVLLSSDTNAAIDIEKRGDRILSIRHKFMHPDEEAALLQSGIHEVTGLLVHWCVKEALFKALPDEGIDFLQEFRLIQLPSIEALEASINTEIAVAVKPGKALYLRSNTAFRVEAWQTPEVVLCVCSTGVIDLA